MVLVPSECCNITCSSCSPAHRMVPCKELATAGWAGRAQGRLGCRECSAGLTTLQSLPKSRGQCAERCSPPVLCTGHGLPELLKDGLQSSLLLVGRKLCSADRSVCEILGLAPSLHSSASALTIGQAAAIRDAPPRRWNAEAGCMDTRGMRAGPRPCPAHTLRLGNMHNIMHNITAGPGG